MPDLTAALMMPWAIPVIMGCCVAMVAILGSLITSCISELAVTNLKRTMVERGYSSAEIQQVVAASSDSEPDHDVPPMKRQLKPTV